MTAKTAKEHLEQLAQWRKERAAAGVEDDDDQWELPTTNPLDNRFRVAVRGRLSELGISEESLAKLLGWDAKALTDLLTVDCPDVAQIEAVCGALGLATGFRVMPATVGATDEDDTDDDE